MSRWYGLEVLVVAAVLTASCGSSDPSGSGGVGGAGGGIHECTTAPVEAQVPTIDGVPVDEALFLGWVDGFSRGMSDSGYCPENFPDSYTYARQEASARSVELALLRREADRLGIDADFDERELLALGDLGPKPNWFDFPLARARVEGRIWRLGWSLVPVEDDMVTDEGYRDGLLANVPAGETEHVSIRAFSIYRDAFSRIGERLDPKLGFDLKREVLTRLERDPAIFTPLAMIFGNPGRVRWEVHLGGDAAGGGFDLESHRGEKVFAIDGPEETWFVIVDGWTSGDVDGRHRELIDERWAEEVHQKAVRAFLRERLLEVTVDAEEGTVLPTQGYPIAKLWYAPPPPGSEGGTGVGFDFPIFDDNFPPDVRRNLRR